MDTIRTCPGCGESYRDSEAPSFCSRCGAPLDGSAPVGRKVTVVLPGDGTYVVSVDGSETARGSGETVLRMSPGVHEICVRVSGTDARTCVSIDVSGGEVLTVLRGPAGLAFDTGSAKLADSPFGRPTAASQVFTHAARFCPHCNRVVTTTRFRPLFLILLIVTIIPFPFYVVYCLMTDRRVCTRCGRRIGPGNR